jgi:hypothetical protein
MAQRRRIGSKTTLPSGRILARVECGYRTDGSRRTMSEVVDTDREADMAIARMATQMGEMPHLGDDVTLAWYYEAMFVPGRAHLANATMARYDSAWKCHIAPAFGPRAMASIRHAEVQAWLYTKTRGTARQCVRTLRAILRQAYADDLLDREPMRGSFRMPAGVDRPGGVWSAEEVAQALPALRGTPVYRIWLVMVGGGAGREEAYALYESDLTYTQVTRMGPDGPEEGWAVSAYVDDAVTVLDGRKAPKNGHRYRTLQIADPFATELRETRSEDPSAPICRVSVSNLPRAWRALWEPRQVSTDGNGRYYRGSMVGTGVPYVPLNRMRATHETLAQLGGVADTLNAAIHGRSNVQTGYRHYLVPGSPALSGAAETVGGIVRDAMGA